MGRKHRQERFAVGDVDDEDVVDRDAAADHSGDLDDHHGDVGGGDSRASLSDGGGDELASSFNTNTSAGRKLAAAASFSSGGERGGSSMAAEAKQQRRAPWLEALYDPMAGLHTISSNIALGDLNGDGEHHLLVGDIGVGTAGSSTLKVFKGTNLISKDVILETPSAVCVFYQAQMDDQRTPSIAVAAGSGIYVFRNLRPYYKFSLPALAANPAEAEAWEQLGSVGDVTALVKQLVLLREDGHVLASRSQELLTLTGAEAVSFVRGYKEVPLTQQTVITTMTTLHKNVVDEYAPSCLVVGTEAGSLFILDPASFDIVAKCQLPSAPTFLAVSGTYDEDYRVSVACRDCSVYSFSNGKLSSTAVHVGHAVTGLVRLNKRLFVGTIDECMHCYSLKGKKLFTTQLDAPITTMKLMEYPPRNFKAVLVALRNAEVRIFVDKQPVEVLHVDGIVTALHFGKFGREEGALIMATWQGGLAVKILHRSFNFDVGVHAVAGPPPEQDIPLSIPRKTKQYVDQAFRERENAVEMHRVFQRDLYMLRLRTAQAYSASLSSTFAPVVATAAAKLKFEVQVQGIGPVFKLQLMLHNLSDAILYDVPVTFGCDDTLYRLGSSVIKVASLVPTLSYTYDVRVECVSAAGQGVVRVFVGDPRGVAPLISAAITMPPCEFVAEDA